MAGLINIGERRVQKLYRVQIGEPICKKYGVREGDLVEVFIGIGDTDDAFKKQEAVNFNRAQLLH